MRTTQTYVLRLLVDNECPAELRGILVSVADNAEYPFADAEALLALLRHVAGAGEGSEEDKRGVPNVGQSREPGGLTEPHGKGGDTGD